MSRYVLSLMLKDCKELSFFCAKTAFMPHAEIENGKRGERKGQVYNKERVSDFL